MIRTPEHSPALNTSPVGPELNGTYEPRPLNQPLPPTRARSRIAQLLDIQSSLRSDFVGTSK